MVERRGRPRLKLEEKLDIVLPVAEAIIAQKSVSEMTLKEVIEGSGLPRASFLNFIPSKETLIGYLAIKGFDKLFAFVERGKVHEGSARIKFLSIYIGHLIFMRLHTVLYQCIFEFGAPSYRKAVDRNLIGLYDTKMNSLIGYIQWTIEQAMFNKEITLPERLTPFDMAFYMWAGQYGVTSMATSTHLNITDATTKYKYYVRQLLDVLPWHPTSVEFDYDMETEKIALTTYLEEFKTLKSLYPDNDFRLKF